MGIWNNNLLPKINCKQYDSQNYKLDKQITVAHLDDWTNDNPALIGNVRVISPTVKEQDATVYLVSPATPQTPNAQTYTHNGKKIYYTYVQKNLTFKRTINAGTMVEDPNNTNFFVIELRGEGPQFQTAGITHIQDPANTMAVAPWGYYGGDLHGNGKFEIFEQGTTTPFKLPLHLDLGAMDGGGISRDVATKGTHIGEKFQMTIDGTFSNTTFDSFKKCAYGGNLGCFADRYSYLSTKVAQTTAVFSALKQSVPPTIDGKNTFIYEPRISQTLNGTDEGDGIYGGDGEIQSDFDASTVDFNYWTNTSGVAFFKLLSSHNDPQISPIKVNECEQRINIHEGIKDCENCGCTNKVNTYVFRKIFNYEGDTTEHITSWMWKDRNLIGVECNYIFDGDNVINIHEKYPFILDYSRRRDLENIDICLRTCTNCNNCSEPKLKGNTVVTQKLNRCTHSLCEKSNPAYDSCGKDISCKDCWEVETKLKYDTSKMCGVKYTEKHKCYKCLRKYKQHLNRLQAGDIDLKIKIRDLVSCNGLNYQEFGDKTIVDLINEINTKLKNKQDKSCVLSYLSTFKTSDFR